jgi:hypothetical protein
MFGGLRSARCVDSDFCGPCDVVQPCDRSACFR